MIIDAINAMDAIEKKLGVAGEIRQLKGFEIGHNSRRWLTTDNINRDCPLLTARNVPIDKKKKKNIPQQRKQPTIGYILPLHSGIPTWFSSEGTVELFNSNTKTSLNKSTCTNVKNILQNHKSKTTTSWRVPLW